MTPNYWRRSAVLFVFLVSSTSQLVAQDNGEGSKPAPVTAGDSAAAQKLTGQAALDEATKLKISAETFEDLGQVVELCEAALRGTDLDEENRAFAEQLLLGTRLQRAEEICLQIFERKPPHEKWMELSRAALIELELAVRTKPDLPEAHFWIGRIHSLPGFNHRRAIGAFDNVIKFAGDDVNLKARALTLRADARRDPDAKLADYNQALEMVPDYVPALRARGMLYMQLNEHEKALADFRRAIQLEPEHAKTHEALALELLLSKDLENAKSSIDRAIELEPEMATAYAHRARIYALGEEYDKALKDMEFALKESPDNILWRMLRAEIYQKADQPEKALADVDQVLKEEPRLLEAVRMRAGLLATLDRIDEAITDLRFAVQQVPGNPDIRMSLGTLYLANQQPRQAIKEFDELLALDVRHWSVYRRRADALLSIGKQAEAIADYDAALKLDPENSGVLNNLAWVLATSPDDKLRDGPRAVDLAKQAAEVTEYKESHILSTLAAAYAENGDYANAVKWSKKAVELGEGEIKEQLSKELASFRAGKPWRELQTTEEKDASDNQPSGEPKTAEKKRTPAS